MKEKKLLRKESGKNVRKVVLCGTAPKAIGPYSQGIALKKLVFFSGQIAIDPATGALVEGGFAEQTKQILHNIDELLKSQGLSAQNVVKTTVFLTDMSKFGEVNAEYANYFSFEPPARSCVAVAAIPMQADVEIEIIASAF